jgi:hypothetical protein
MRRPPEGGRGTSLVRSDEGYFFAPFFAPFLAAGFFAAVFFVAVFFFVAMCSLR